MLAPSPSISPSPSATLTPPPSPTPVGVAASGISLQDWLAFGQVISGIIALAIAIMAIHQARMSGREVFQLSVLRDLLALTDRAGLPHVSAAAARLAMLPDNQVKFWREWVRSRDEIDQDRTTDEMIADMGPPEGLSDEERYRWAFREDIRRTVEDKGHRTSRLTQSPARHPFWGTWR